MKRWDNGTLINCEVIEGYAICLKSGMWLSHDDKNNIQSTTFPQLFYDKVEANKVLGEALMKGIITIDKFSSILPLELRERKEETE